MSTRLRIGAVRNNVIADHLHSGQDAANSDTDAHDIPAPDDFSFRPLQSYPGCFGLPYQDHNYGAPPPMSPPPPPPRSPTPPPPPAVNGPAQVEEEAKVPAVSNEEEVVEDSITRCICGFLHDDGYMICCDKCSVWQHIDCMEIDRNNIPESYCCEICEPRELDVERARMIQLRRREEIDTSATDTDPEEPANALASLGRKPVVPKPKGSKQRRVNKTGARLLKTGKLAKAQHLKKDKKLKLTKKEKENMKDALKKQKIGKAGLQKEKKMKKKLNTSLCQNKAVFWNFLNEPMYPVIGALENEYSQEILDFLSHVKSNGAHSPHSIGVFPEELLVQLYKVSEIKKNIKGLEATQLIVPGKAVIEFKGKVMLRQHYLQDHHFNSSEPYVLYYSKFEGLDLCIDASAFGGDARFIRRSCTPNAEMCHIIDNGSLHFIVQAKKEIPKGVEITIPFDFNYQESPTSVECACGRTNCPVTKFWKKINLAQNKSPDKPKRKRQASGEGRVRRNSQGKGSPVKVTSSGNKSPVKYSPTKNSAAVPSLLSCYDSSEAVDVTAHGDTEFDFAALVKASSSARRSSRSSSELKEEKDTKPARSSQHKESSIRVSFSQDSTSDIDIQHSTTNESAQPTSETEAESSCETHRKLTREERKMEAIMKAFEKMERREERRKEALARMDKKHEHHIKEEPAEPIPAPEISCYNCLEPDVDGVPDQTLQSSFNYTSLAADADKKPVINLEDNLTTTAVDSPQKTVRHKRIKRKRRNSRVMSALEPLCTSPPRPPPVMMRISLTPSAPVVDPPCAMATEEVKEEPVEQLPQLSQAADPPATSPVDPLPLMMEETPPYMFHKKKKYLFNDCGGSRSPEGPSREEEMFVSCTPGPRSSMEHIQRRNSTSATYGRASDSAKGNAKKRWLRQAMYETVPLRVDAELLSPRPPPSDSGSPPSSASTSQAPVPGPSATVTSATAPALQSPNGSPTDFVTPLKKRRLAPEFLPSTSSAAPLSPAISEESAFITSPVIAECTASSSTSISSEAAKTVPTDTVQMTPSSEKRPRMKGTCLFGRKNGNGLLVPSSTPSSACDASSSLRSVFGSLSRDVLSTSTCSNQTGGVMSAVSLASSTVGSIADSAEASSEGSFDGAGTPASSSTAACVIFHSGPGPEGPLVDSSDAAVETDQARVSPQDAASGDSPGVCSSNNEVSTLCVNSADSDSQEERRFSQEGGVAESSSVASSGRPYLLQDQDEDVSESQPSADQMEVEDEGNEASGSVSVSEELSRHTEQVRCAAPQPAADCQVNSSQDSLFCSRTTLGLGSPSQREADCRLSSQCLLVDRTEDPRSDIADASERAGVSSALDCNLEDRERGGVSSAKDVTAVSSVVSMLMESENLGSSDPECGPSSSTQTSHSQFVDTMLCHSSDITGSTAVSFICEDGKVDSTTTQAGVCVVRVDLNQCDTADSNLQAAENEESCCDSNSDEHMAQGVVGDRGGVSSSGPADSQGDALDSRQGMLSISSCILSCNTASVSSSHYSISQTEAALGTSVSSSVFSHVHLDSAPEPQLANMASNSNLSTADSGDLSAPSQSTSQHRQSIPRVDLSPPQAVSPALDGVDTSDQSSQSHFPSPEQCEASTSFTNDRRAGDEGESSSRPVSSSLQQSQSDVELPMSSGNLDSSEERAVVNGDQPHVSMVSSVSEDSSGSSSYVCNPSATVSSSEAQPTAKRKVSLSEYRSRRKDKTGSAASTSSATSPKSSSDMLSRDFADHCMSLAPLPLFEPISLRENREHKEEKEKREKPMSLSDRLRIEFGLETTSEDDEKDNSTGPLKKTSDIPPPPPPPLPRNGKVGGVGGRKPSSVGGPQTSKDNEEESPQASSSSTFTGNSSPAPVVPQGDTGSLVSTLTALYAKLQHHRPMATTLSAQPASAPAFTAGSVVQQQQRLPQSYNASGSGDPHLSNGSHAPAAFSTAALFPASSSQGQPHAQSFPPMGVKQQANCAPPPPPSTAYPHYLAQSLTHCLRTQTPVVGVRHADQTGPSVSVSQSPQSSVLAATPVGNGVVPNLHMPLANSANSHSHGRYHFSPFSHNETVNHVGSYSSDNRKRR